MMKNQRLVPIALVLGLFLGGAFVFSYKKTLANKVSALPQAFVVALIQQVSKESDANCNVVIYAYGTRDAVWFEIISEKQGHRFDKLYKLTDSGNEYVEVLGDYNSEGHGNMLVVEGRRVPLLWELFIPAGKNSQR